VGRQWEKLDIAIALVGVLVGVAVLAMAVIVVPDQYGMAITILLTAGGYLAMRESLGDSRQAQVTVNSEAHRRGWLVRVATGCVLVLSTVVVGVSCNSMGRPYWVFFLLSIIPVCILFQILSFSQLSEELEMLLLLQVVFLLAAIVLSGAYVFPYNGGDTWGHIRNASEISNSGTIEGIKGAYRNYPFYPAVIAALSELTGLGLQQVARLDSLVGALIGLLSLYGLARIYYSASQSLVLALLLVGSKWFIYWTINVVSMVASLWFFCLFVTIAFKRFSTPLRPQAVLAIIVFAVSVPFFHPLGAAAAVMLFSACSVLDMITSGGKGSQWRRSLVGLSILMAVLTLTQWMYYGTTFESGLRSLADTVLGIDEPQLGSSYRSAIVYNLDQLNLYILYSLSGLGILRALRLRQPRVDIYTGLIGLGFALFGYLTQVLVIRTLVGHRWLIFASLLLAFPASLALLYMIRRGTAIVRCLLLVTVACYFLLGFGSPDTSRDAPLYAKETTGLLEVTSSEYTGLLYLRGLTGGRLQTDIYLCSYLSLYIPRSRLNCWSQVDFAQIEGRFVFRDAYLDRSVLVGKDLAGKDLAFQEESGVMLLYDSGDFKVFERVPTSSYGSE
jgi:hypothetical protein